MDAGSNLTPEARRRQAQRWRDGLQERIRNHAGPGTRFFTVVRRVWTGAYYDGFIHAGNLAYMAILALFPFFIAVAAILSAIGEQSQREAAINAFITAVPPMVAKVIEPVARDAVAARSGWLLWVGGLFGLWTATSLIETIRDILRRAYGTPATRAFWQYRLGSTGVIFAAVMLLLLALSAQVLISALQEVIAALFPELLGLFDTLVYSRLVSAAILFGSIYLLFISLSPEMYKGRAYPKWPGALLVTLWWVAVMLVLPPVLRTFFTYDLTYGSLAGVMIALFFFWLVGLGMVVGAELNAALTETPEERDMLGRYGGGEAQQGENGQGNGE
ncbi:MAG: YihY/virulence factor BrkB family protein [Novosphingobium sp.]|nr:YihY/virulence factor BrkB family protein [Novosphingobium sp.]